MKNEMMTRPKAGDPYVQLRAAELMLPDVKRYLGKDSRNYTDRQLLENLAKHIKHRDGYEIVQEMESLSGWVGDSELVGLMNDATYQLSTAVEELTRQWVQCVPQPMLFAVGDSVVCERLRRDGEMGTIYDIRPELAQYGVRYPDMGETQRYVVEAEYVTAPAAPVMALLSNPEPVQFVSA